MTFPASIVTLLLCSLILAGCSAVPREEYPAAEIPAEWQQPTSNQQAKPSAWIQDFNDPLLETLIQQALANNHDLKASAARVEAALAQARIVGADLNPTVNGGVDAQRRRSNPENNGVTNSNYNTDLGVGVDVSWEIDLWGRLSSRARAATLDFEVTEAEWRAAQLSLSASVARSWFNLAEAQLQLDLVEQRLSNLSDNLITIEEDFKLGLRGALDVYLARADVAGEQARLANRRSTLMSAKRTLELLLGQYPEGLISSRNTLTPLSSPIPSGLPSELLQRRPDLIANQKRLASTNQLAAAAHADRFPRLTLTGDIGTRSSELSNLVSSDYLVWSVFGGLSAPLFDSGRLEAEEERAVANIKVAEANYNQALLTAFQEVEEGLVNETLLQQQEAALKTASEESIEAENLAFDQYQNGLLEFITVLESQRRSFDAQSAEIDVRNQRLQNRINLYLALGGAFVDDSMNIQGANSPTDAHNTEH
ncbi:efflux transporter outer membrane subunit [Alkalimarinus sediminis]|uniref:Efflux transporter outer membrane subunit n=1 Tax=Alkalimarinus sediminis TaxID=1632866 RepID=A0A9E8HQS2_9ALTE|nr:efflux transporter outer membrane subunit [Alkalimarinus sediminis]UZW74801.1 efflux transporter outer membrane subunit [Alkalimarinus sediminis]